MLKYVSFALLVSFCQFSLLAVMPDQNTPHYNDATGIPHHQDDVCGHFNEAPQRVHGEDLSYSRNEREHGGFFMEPSYRGESRYSSYSDGCGSFGGSSSGGEFF